MKIRFALSLCVLFWVSGTVFAQCNHQGDCVQGICPQPLGPCGSSNDWKDNFFNCCKAKQFEGPICDPCCNIPYFSLSGGYSNLHNITRTTVSDVFTDPEVLNPGTPPNFNDYLAKAFDIKTESERGFILEGGYTVTGAVGYRVHKVARIEAEFSFRQNDVRSFYTEDVVTTSEILYNDPSFGNGSVVSVNTVVGSPVETAASGTLQSYSGMFNAYYDFSWPRIHCLNLYLGGGLGMSYLTGDITTDTINYEADTGSFAYQLIFGGNLPLTKRLDLFSDYRFLGMSNISIDDTTNNLSLGRADPVVTHNVNFGIRYRFGCR